MESVAHNKLESKCNIALNEYVITYMYHVVSVNSSKNCLQSKLEFYMFFSASIFSIYSTVKDHWWQDIKADSSV